METTKKSISPRITDANIAPVLEDTPVEKTVEKEVVQSEPHVRSESMPTFFKWMVKYGRTNFMIPLMGKSTEPEFVQINGMIFLIDKGVFLDLPMNIATLLGEKYNIQTNIGRNVDGKDMRIDGNSAKSAALN